MIFRSAYPEWLTSSPALPSWSLNVIGVVETWHDAHDCPDLIACASPGYSYIDRPRLRLGSLAVNLRSNHGGVALLYRNDVHVRKVSLPEYKSFEQVSAFLQCPSFSTLAVVIYRPGTLPATEEFFIDFSDVLERVATYSNLLIVGTCTSTIAMIQ